VTVALKCMIMQICLIECGYDGKHDTRYGGVFK